MRSDRKVLDRLESARRGQRGYSAIELTVVLGMLAVVMAIGFIVLGRNRTNRQLDAAANEMVAALKFARSAAISQNGGVSFNFVTSNPPGYTVTNSSGQNIRGDNFSPEVTMTVAGATNPVTFAANGVPSGTPTINMTAGTGRQATISLAGTTANVTLSIH
jgi:prepilin-type N-terminal cleavage/methylation domain-containing protein